VICNLALRAPMVVLVIATSLPSASDRILMDREPEHPALGEEVGKHKVGVKVLAFRIWERFRMATLSARLTTVCGWRYSKTLSHSAIRHAFVTPESYYRQ